MSSARSAKFLATLVCGILLTGCGNLSTGALERPEYYPDRTSADAAMATFLWAWHEGDLEVLDQVLGMWLHKELEEFLNRNPKEEVVDYYRKGAEGLEIRDYDWKKTGDEIHYLRMVLATDEVDRFELDFALYRFPLGWVVTGQKLVPRATRGPKR
ncbi:MAG: hypothetical protein JKY65_31420 [Planctomycetes bacterium]|nr:hypothetical protein [Planctomycetota bacterium]